MANKWIVTTVQTVYTRYYVEVDDPEWAGDSIVCGELEQYSNRYLSEDVLEYLQVDEYPESSEGPDDQINGATYKAITDENGDFVEWEMVVKL